MKYYLSLFTIVFCYQIVFAQVSCKDTIYMIGNKYYQHDEVLIKMEVVEVLKKDTSLSQLLDVYHNTQAADVFVSIIAGAALGYGLSPLLFPRENNNQALFLGISAVGVGALFWSLHLGERKNEKLMSAVKAYNNNLIQTCK